MSLSVTGSTRRFAPAGDVVTISGLGFASGMKVAFAGAAPVARRAFVSPTPITAKVPATAAAGAARRHEGDDADAVDASFARYWIEPDERPDRNRS